MVTMRSSSGMNEREHVEQRRLARAGAAGDDDVQPRDDAGAQELGHLGRHASRSGSGRRRVSGVLENLRMVIVGPTSEIGRDDDVHAGAVGQARVAERATTRRCGGRAARRCGR